MKWPNTLSAIRHGESAYNALKVVKATDPLYLEFKQAYENPQADQAEVMALAHAVHESGRLQLPHGNHDTPLTAEGVRQAEVTGSRLSSLIELPDIVMVSPYDRTWQTYQGLVRGWPELGEVDVVENERIREQEHGISEIYGDWRIFYALNPDQRKYFELNGQYSSRYPQGENVPDVRDRVGTAIGRVMDEYHDRDVMWVTHHLTILALRAYLERMSRDEFLHLDATEPPVNSSVTIYRGNPDIGRDGRFLLDVYNEKLY